MNNGRTFICILCNSRIPKCISISEMLTTSKFKRSMVDLSFRENDVQLLSPAVAPNLNVNGLTPWNHGATNLRAEVNWLG